MNENCESYATRLEQAFGCVTDEKLRGKKLAEEAAFIGACAERDHVLEILARLGLRDVANEVRAMTIDDVLRRPL